MPEEKRSTGPRDREFRPSEDRKRINITYAHSQGHERLDAILHYALMSARSAKRTNAELMLEIIHEIKFRLNVYYEAYGESVIEDARDRASNSRSF